MKDLTTGSVTRHLLHMSAFLAMSMVVQTLYLLADLYWVGHLGKEAIAAVGVAGNITMIVLALTQMLGVGTTTLISQAAGRKDQLHAEMAFNQSFGMSIVIALALGVVGFILRPADRNLFRKEISLSAFSFSSVSPTNKNLARIAADRRAGRRGVFAAVCVHHDCLRDHPRLRTGSSGWLRNRRTRDAGAFSAGSCA